MTSKDVIRKIDKILYHENRYIKNGTYNLCKQILLDESFSIKIKNQILKIKAEVEKLEEPWGYFSDVNKPDLYMFNNIRSCLNDIYQLME